VRHSYGFWLVTFNCGAFFEGGPGTLYILLLLSFCFMQLLFVGVGEYVRNNWHLAANFGTNPRVVFLGGVGPLSFHLGRCEVVFKRNLLCFFVKRCFIIYRWYSSYRKLMQPRLAAAMCGQAVCFFLFLCGVPDFLFLWLVFSTLWGLLFESQMGFYNILVAFWLALIVVSVWRKGYVQNYCPLVANFGTRACGFAVGIWFCIYES